MKNAQPQTIALFVELVKTELSNYSNVTLNMKANTIQYFQNLTPFNKFPLFYWYSVVSAHIE